MRVLVGLLVALLLLGSFATAAQADELDVLLERFEQVRTWEMLEGGQKMIRECLNQIANLNTPRARKELRALREDWAGLDWQRGVFILEVLLRHGGPADIDEAIRWVEATEKRRRRQGEAPFLRWSLAWVLSQVQDEAAREHLREKTLKRARPDVRIQVIRALGRMRDQKALPALIKLLNAGHAEVRLEAASALGALQNQDARIALTRLLKKSDPRMRLVGVEALGRLRVWEAVPAIRSALKDEEPRVVEAAAIALATMECESCFQELIDAMRRHTPQDLRTAFACAEALESMSGKAFGLDADVWAEWWSAVKDEPFIKDRAPAEGRTIPGLPYYGLRIQSSRITFVLDVSESMERNDRLALAKRELIKVVESLPETTRFNIITFSSGVHPWADRVLVATEVWIQQATRFVGRQEPRGGTNTYGALRAAFDVHTKAREDALADTIVFLTDGIPSEGELVDMTEILIQVHEWNRLRRLRIHCIALLTGDPPVEGLGQGAEEAAEEFLRLLAEGNSGTLEVLR